MGRRKKELSTKQEPKNEKITTEVQDDNETNPKVVKKAKKRGRKPKKPKEETEIKKKAKKRGRKPKGGKIIHKSEISDILKKNKKKSIILHLKCKSQDIDPDGIKIDDDINAQVSNILRQQRTGDMTVQPFDYSENTILRSNSLALGQEVENVKENIEGGSRNEFLNFPTHQKANEKIKDDNQTNKKQTEISPGNVSINKIDNEQLWERMNSLKKKLHFNIVEKEHAACFYCTCEFNTPVIYIPKQIRNNKYEVYGCYCSPECAVGDLKRERLDHSVFCERYALLNKVYRGIFNYESNIKPAPNPYYTLDKYRGNLSIDEYRALLNCQNIMFVVDKPMTNIFPELFEDNNNIPSMDKNNLLNRKKSTVLRLRRNNTSNSKKDIINRTFNL